MNGLSMVVMNRLMTLLRPGATGMTNRFRVEKPPYNEQQQKVDRECMS